jgi:hypothetical protein
MKIIEPLIDQVVGKIVVELDTKYTSPKDAVPYVIEHLTSEGRACVINTDGTLDVDEKRYSVTLSQRVFGPFNPQTAVLRPVL